MKLTTARRLSIAAFAYLALAVLLTAGGARPLSAAAEMLSAAPALTAALAAAFAARRTGATERLFWALLAASCAADLLRPVLWAVGELVQGSPLPPVGLATDATVVLLIAALLVRPHRPRTPHDLPTSALDWLMAVVGGYFLVLYFVLLPAGQAISRPGLAGFAVRDLLPLLIATALALTVREPPFGVTYRLIAFGLALRALVGLAPQAIQGHGAASGWWTLVPAVTFFPIAAAALLARGPEWVRPSVQAGPSTRPARLAVLAVAAPPLLDLVVRGMGLQPHLADQRSSVAVACSSMLTVLAALRVRRRGHRRSAIGEATEARRALGEPTASLQFASGVAHELNNPLMAVSGWAELALRRGAPEETVRRLMEATRAAADAVGRLQQITRSSDEVR